MKAKLALMLASVAIAAVALSGTAEAQMQKVKVATEGAYAPFNFKDTSGQLQGFDVDIAKALCAKAKFDCEIVAQDWDGTATKKIRRPRGNPGTNLGGPPTADTSRQMRAPTH